MSKGDIGELYCKIDPHYQMYRPDNAYRAVERVCKAKQGNPSDPMLYYKEQGKGLPATDDTCTCTCKSPNDMSEPHYKKRNVDRREARREKKINNNAGSYKRLWILLLNIVLQQRLP